MFIFLSKPFKVDENVPFNKDTFLFLSQNLNNLLKSLSKYEEFKCDKLLNTPVLSFAFIK